MKWFRMYHEARTDEKLKSLTDAQFRVWFRLMCYANDQKMRGTIPTRAKRLMAVEVSQGDIQLYEETMSVLEELEIVDITDESIQITHWDERQYKSDESTNRWRKWNEKQQSNVEQTLDKQQSNNEPTTVQRHLTPPDTDTDTDKRNKEIKDHVQPTGYTPEFDSFWNEYPRHKEKQAAFKTWNTRLKERVSPSDLILAAINYANECRERGTAESYIKLPKTFLGSSRPYEDYLKRLEEQKEQKEQETVVHTTPEEKQDLEFVYARTYTRSQ